MRLSPLSHVDTEAMIAIPARTLLMGADDGFVDERPQHTVFVKRDLIGKCEMTNRRFRAAGLRPSRSYGNQYEFPQLPVVSATWFQAQAYCHKMGKRLPSAIEWERAARGVDGRFFPRGNFWHQALADDGRGPKSLGSFPNCASPYGVLDMAGNVWEWAQDTFSNHKPPRILRGGGWS
jgi:iron(II)-dependent oxidoreductase